MIKYDEMRKMLDLCGYEKGICSTCMGGNGNCESWNNELGANSMCGHGGYYANKSECEALLKYWDDKEGSVEEWRRNNVPMNKYKTGKDCQDCMGHGDCQSWIQELGFDVDRCGAGRGHKKLNNRPDCYANKAQTEALLQWYNDRYGSINDLRKCVPCYWLENGECTVMGCAPADRERTEALLKWHNERYGSIEQARLESVKDILKDGFEDLIKIARGDKDKDHSKGGYRQYPHGLQPKKEIPKPFADLEEFDLKIIKMFIERRKIKFRQLCLGLGLECEDVDRIIAGIK